MYHRSRWLILAAAAFLTGASLGHAQDQPAADFRFVWLINTYNDGDPLGVFVYPERMTLAACAARARRDWVYKWTPWERSVGDYIAQKLGAPIGPAIPLCLTDSETDALVRAVREPLDLTGEEV